MRLLACLFGCLCVLPLSKAAENLQANLVPLAGFELRLLDRKFHLDLVVSGKSEDHELPVWLYLPKSNETSGDISDWSEAADLTDLGGLLPKPPVGIGLRALKQRMEQGITLADGRTVTVQVPVFIYFRKTPLSPLLRASSSDDIPVRAQGTIGYALEVKNAASSARTSGTTHGRLSEMRNEFASLLPVLPEGTARERFKVLLNHWTEIAAAEGEQALTPLGSGDVNPH